MSGMLMNMAAKYGKDAMANIDPNQLKNMASSFAKNAASNIDPNQLQNMASKAIDPNQLQNIASKAIDPAQPQNMASNTVANVDMTPTPKPMSEEEIEATIQPNIIAGIKEEIDNEDNEHPITNAVSVKLLNDDDFIKGLSVKIKDLLESESESGVSGGAKKKKTRRKRNKTRRKRTKTKRRK